MGIFRVTEKDKLKLFRKHFRTLTADSTYPPERQQQLFQWCRKVGLDWNRAREYVVEDATKIAWWHLEQIVDDRQVTTEELLELRRLHRRLGLADDAEPLQQFYVLVEQKIKDRIIERAAYLGSEPAVESIKQEIQRYILPAHIEQRLLGVVNRQHALAQLTAGRLPVIMPSVTLSANEACHFEAKVSFLANAGINLSAGDGILIVTSQRLLILSQKGGYAARWSEVAAIQYLSSEWLEIKINHSRVVVSHPDTQYVATFLVNAKSTYARVNPEPIRPNKRLA